MAVLIGLTTCGVIGYALLCAIGKTTPTVAHEFAFPAAIIALIDSIVHSPQTTLTDAIAQTAPGFYLADSFVRRWADWLVFIQSAIAIAIWAKKKYPTGQIEILVSEM